MEQHSLFCYTWDYETKRICCDTGVQTPASCATVQGRQKSFGCGSLARNRKEFCFSVVVHLQKERPARLEAQTCARTPLQTSPASKAPIAPIALAWSIGRRILYGPLDNPTDCRNYLETFPYPVRPRSYRPVAKKPRMELAEAGTAGFGKGRGIYRKLEKAQMAAYKKKPKYLAPISFSSMKAGFFLFPTSVRHGLRWERPLCFGIATAGIKYPRYPALLFPPNANAWASISVSTPPTSRTWKFCNSSACSCGICEAISYSCGMAAKFTGTRK